MLLYDVDKEKGGRYFVFSAENPGKPIAGTYKKDKKDALHIAAKLNEMEYKEFLKERKKTEK